jgi:hypothetical protein
MKRFHANRTLAMLLFPLIAVEKSCFLGLCRIKRF